MSATYLLRDAREKWRAQRLANFRLETVPTAVSYFSRGYIARTRRGGRGRLTATLFAWLPRSRSHVPTVAQNDAVIQIVTLIRTERI